MAVHVDQMPGRPPAASAPAEIIESWLPAFFSAAARKPEGCSVIFPHADLFEFLPSSANIVELLSPESQELELLHKLDGRIKFELEGRRRRRWSVDAAFGRAGMLAGRPRTTVIVDSGTCEKLAARAINPLQALLAGRLRVEGDKTFAMQVLMLVATRIGG